MAAVPSSTAAAAAVAPPRICFNSHCKEPRPEGAPRRKGWRLRSGELADLCDRCCGTYEQGTFCETFHADDGGWRNCESCAKRVHCGCIVSHHAYLLLDAGGVECIACARKSMVTAPNQMRPSSSFLPLQTSERLKDLPAKSWNQMTGSYPGQWRQAPKIWNLSTTQTELQRRISYEFDRPSCSEKVLPGGRSQICMPEKKIDDLSERIAYNSLSHHATRDRFANGNTGLDSVSAYSTFHKDEGNTDGMPDSGHLLGETDTRRGAMPAPCSASSSGVNLEAYPGPSIGSSVPSAGVKDESSSPIVGLAAPYPLQRDSNEQSRVPTNQALGQSTSQPLGKQLYLNPHNVNESSGELQAQMRSGRSRVDGRNRNHLLNRYCPRITSEELQQISGDSNSVITPLFEKILSASDAGRIGRLVLPKKCAEAYFPPISQPEGLPLKVQDATGREWVFQFRFWPNNNSRMYVLEGVTPCIQSMQLLAGDTVTFSRIDPERKLVMGFRKAASISSEQETQASKTGNGLSTPSEANNRNGTPSESIANSSVRPPKGSTESKSLINAEDQMKQSNFDKTGFIQKDGNGSKASPGPTKKKGSALGSKSKRLRIENEDSIELKITWEEAQELLRPPPNHASKIVIIEGQEVEEYEEAPVVGKPIFLSTDQAGEKQQWAQCENCSKWRKLPVDALLPFRWTCSDNTWDRERASCASPQELSKENLAALLPANTGASKKSKAKVENENVEVSDGLDTLANLAILGEGESLPSSSQATTRHPRHRPGCTCIVCIQPPSGKGPKHHQACTCNVCLTVKRRFRTLMLRREMRQSEKEAEKKQQQVQSSGVPPQVVVDQPVSTNTNFGGSAQEKTANDDGAVEEESERRTAASSSPLKAKIDLNIQPEREEEPTQPRDLSDASNCRGWLPRADAEDETAE